MKGCGKEYNKEGDNVKLIYICGKTLTWDKVDLCFECQEEAKG